MEMNFCRRCGKALEVGVGEYVCENGHEMFANPSPATGVALITERRQVVLAVRGVDPGKGKLDLAGGFCELHESLEQAAARELKEELGLTTKDYGKLEYVMSVSGAYEFGGETNTALGVCYWAKLRPDAKITAGDDVAGTVTLAANEIDFDEVASEGERSVLRRLIDLGVIQ